MSTNINARTEALINNEVIKQASQNMIKVVGFLLIFLFTNYIISSLRDNFVSTIFSFFFTMLVNWTINNSTKVVSTLENYLNKNLNKIGFFTKNGKWFNLEKKQYGFKKQYGKIYDSISDSEEESELLIDSDTESESPEVFNKETYFRKGIIPAIKNNNFRRIKELEEEFGFDCYLEFRNGHHCFWDAIRLKNSEIIQHYYELFFEVDSKIRNISKFVPPEEKEEDDKPKIYYKVKLNIPKLITIERYNLETMVDVDGNNPYFWACRCGNIDFMKNYKSDYIDNIDKEEVNKIMFRNALISGSLECLKYVEECGYTPTEGSIGEWFDHYNDKDYETYSEMEDSYLEIVKYMDEKYESLIFDISYKGANIYLAMCALGFLKIIKWLDEKIEEEKMDKTKHIYLRSDEGYDAYLLASHCGHVDIMIHLLGVHGWNSNTKFHNKNKTVLEEYCDAYLVAIEGDRPNVMEYLENNHNIDLSRRLKFGFNYYTYAIACRSKEAAKYIAKNHNYTNIQSIRTNNGLYPYLVAIQTGDIEIVKYIEDNFEDSYVPKKKGNRQMPSRRMPVYDDNWYDQNDDFGYMCDFGNNYMGGPEPIPVKRKTNKIKEKFNSRIVDNSGKNAMEIAIACGHIEIMKYLVEQKGWGKNELANRKYENSYLSACRYGSIDVMEFLESFWGADPYCRNSQGCNAYHIAAETYNMELLKYLERRHKERLEEDPNMVDELEIDNYNNENAFQYILKIGNGGFMDDPYSEVSDETKKKREEVLTYLGEKEFRNKFKNCGHKTLKQVYEDCELTLEEFSPECGICRDELKQNDLCCSCDHAHIIHIECYLQYLIKNKITDPKCTYCMNAMRLESFNFVTEDEKVDSDVLIDSS